MCTHADREGCDENLATSVQTTQCGLVYIWIHITLYGMNIKMNVAAIQNMSPTVVLNNDLDNQCELSSGHLQT